MRKEAPDTVDEIVAEKYNIYFPKDDEHFFRSFYKLKGMKVIKPYDLHPDFFHFKNKNSWMQPRTIKGIENLRRFYKVETFDDPVKLLKDNAGSFFMGFRMYSNNLYFRMFAKEFQKLFEAGITEMIDQQTMADITRNLKDYFEIHVETRDEVTPLTLTDLHAGFIIWLSVVLVTIFVFICELIKHKCTREMLKIQQKRRIMKKNQTRINLKVKQIQVKPTTIESKVKKNQVKTSHIKSKK